MPYYDTQDADELAWKFYQELYDELGDVQDDDFDEDEPVWYRLSRSEQHVIETRDEQLVSLVEPYAEQLDSYADRHWFDEKYKDLLIEHVPGVGAYRRDQPYFLISAALSTKRITVDDYLDRYRDEIAAAEHPGDLATRIDRSTTHWSRNLGEEYDDFYENLWDVLHEPDPPLPVLLDKDDLLDTDRFNAIIADLDTLVADRLEQTAVTGTDNDTSRIFGS